MSTVEATTRHLGVQYTGGNASAVAAAIGGTVVSEVGGVLTVRMNGDDFPLSVGDWFMWTTDGSTNACEGLIPDALYQVRYFPRPHLVTSKGSAAVPAKALGGTQTVTVTLSPPLSTTDYEVVERMRGAANIVGGHSVTDVAVVDEDTVEVEISSAVGSLSGASLHLTVYELV